MMVLLIRTPLIHARFAAVITRSESPKAEQLTALLRLLRRYPDRCAPGELRDHSVLSSQLHLRAWLSYQEPVFW